MNSHFPLNVKIKLGNNFFFIYKFLNTFANKLSLINLKPWNIAIDLRHRVQKKKNNKRNF